MNTKRFYIILVVLMALVMSGCVTKKDVTTQINTVVNPITLKVNEIDTRLANIENSNVSLAANDATIAKQLDDLQKSVDKVGNAPTADEIADKVMLQIEAETAVEAEAVAAEPIVDSWTQVQVSLYGEGHDVAGKLWELPLGTHFAVTTANGFYEAVNSVAAGVVDGKDLGWCKPDQFDCPPHALLVLVEVPSDKVSCLNAEMDISWRIQIKNSCGAPVPMKVSIRYNDVTRSSSELMEDYLALAGLEQQVLNATSEVGLFVSVRENGMSTLTYQDKKVDFGYSCWDCLPDTMGPGDPVPYPLTDIETFGLQGSGPSGSALLPGVVFPLPRPTVDPYILTFEVTIIDQSVIWIGRYDVPLSSTDTP